MLWTPIHARIHALLRSKILLPKGMSILMAVSGGQDSLCMAKLLLDLQSKWEWQLAIVHCDHGWRDDSAENASHVFQLAQQCQIPCFVEQARSLATTEAAARSWRYGVFADLASTHGFQYVVTGHTATDRAETVLYNLLRGSGTDGIQALSWQRPLGTDYADILVTRPLLELTRKETWQFCNDLGLSVWYDSSNDDLHYRRNRIRQELMPYLRSHFNPNVENTLAQTAEIFTAEVAYLDEQADQLYNQVVERLSDAWYIHQALYRAAPLALQRRVARRLLKSFLPQQPNFDHIEKLVALANAPNLAQTDPFPGGFIARVEKDRIKLHL
ncbi:MAG: tRNA lysidine(34) synthetase TilS [Leptolyngbya sp. SIO3F4]|nr:tRNA lysidine(34) synthetase TilS [Leptolyngbya sp. SIO3F4]